MKKQFILLFAICLIGFGIYAQPAITSFSPASGPVGTLVTVTGANLSSPTVFTIGGVSAVVVSNTGTTLVGLVMPGAATGAVSVTASGTATSSGSFIITPTPYPQTQQGSKLVGTGAANDPIIDTITYYRSAFIDTIYNIDTASHPHDTLGHYFDTTSYSGIYSGASYYDTTTYYDTTFHNGGQGWAVSLSADGNTSIVGDPNDNDSTGALWVYTRSGTTWTQQGSKLVGTGLRGAARQGYSVALSADGNTAIVGGPDDASDTGAVWVYTRSGTTWTQQGSKLVGAGASGLARQGWSVSLSADGNTAIAGGPYDTVTYGNTYAGAAWIYTRSGTTWTQQGSKLIGTGAVNDSAIGAQQGWSVALSADGNTAIVGGNQDDSLVGAAWVYTRSGTTWAQQGGKLVGTRATAAAQQGYSVALSADGSTAIVGGPYDSASNAYGPYIYGGAAWVYTRSGTTWAQQGSKLNGTDSATYHGTSVALSADGNVALVGGPGIITYSAVGSVLVYLRDTGTWSPPYGGYYYNSIIGTGGLNPTYQGHSVALSADGRTAIEGGYGDDNGKGAAWVFITTDTTFYDTICASALPYSWRGLTFDSASIQTTTPGIAPYYFQYPATLILTTGSGSTSTTTITDSIFQGQSFVISGHTYTQTGTYTDTLAAVHVCDSIIHLQLVVVPFDSALTLGQSFSSLFVSQHGDSYQWINCTTGQPIVGADSQSYTPAQSGSYACIVTIDHSSDTTACDAFVLGINEMSLDNIRVYPNPTGDMINIYSAGTEGLYADLSDLSGKIILGNIVINSSIKTLDLSAISVGIYMLKIVNKEGANKVIKVIKE